MTRVLADDLITLKHGAGGRAMRRLIEDNGVPRSRATSGQKQ